MALGARGSIFAVYNKSLLAEWRIWEAAISRDFLRYNIYRKNISQRMRKTAATLLLIFWIGVLTSPAMQPKKGYRGFVDGGMTYHIEITLYEQATDSYALLGGSTTHGYQLNNWLFLGGGIGYERLLNNNWRRPKRILPVYGDARGDFKWGRFTPFAELRLGANFTHRAGLYMLPSVGYRFNWGRKWAINFGFGVTFFGIQHHTYEEIWQPEGWYEQGDVTGHNHWLHIYPSLRLGFEF